MTIKQFAFNALSENTFVVYDETGECIIIDPGCFEQDEKNELKNFISDNNLTVKTLINTHCHIDHVLGNNFIKKERDKMQRIGNKGLSIHVDISIAVCCSFKCRFTIKNYRSSSNNFYYSRYLYVDLPSLNNFHKLRIFEN